MDDRYPGWGETFGYIDGAYALEAPFLLESEMGQVIHHKHPQLFGHDPDTRTEALHLLLYGIRRVPSDDASRARCAHLVETFGLSYYDAEFLELAARDDTGLLLTQDQRLLDAARRHLSAERAADLDGAAARITAGSL